MIPLKEPNMSSPRFVVIPLYPRTVLSVLLALHRRYHRVPNVTVYFRDVTLFISFLGRNVKIMINYYFQRARGVLQAPGSIK